MFQPLVLSAQLLSGQTIIPTGLQATGAVGVAVASLAEVVAVTGVSATGSTSTVNVWSLVDKSQTANWKEVP